MDAIWFWIMDDDDFFKKILLSTLACCAYYYYFIFLLFKIFLEKKNTQPTIRITHTHMHQIILWWLLWRTRIFCSPIFFSFYQFFSNWNAKKEFSLFFRCVSKKIQQQQQNKNITIEMMFVCILPPPNRLVTILLWWFFIILKFIESIFVWKKHPDVITSENWKKT